MKYSLINLFVIILFANSSLFSETIINRSDYPIESSYEAKSLLEYKTDLTPPSSGDNQTWDLSNLVTTHFIAETYVDAVGDDYYHDAISYKSAKYALNDFEIESKDFYSIDDQGYTRIGRRITEVEYSIAQLTGGANDKLKIVGGNFPIEGRLDFIKFPLTYEQTWTEKYTIPTNYKLTVEAYSLNETPGVFNSYVTETRTVIGSGKLTIPNKDGGLITMDALLIKAETNNIDSVFLGGQPAPPQLMAAFGLTQGAVSNRETYIYYAPGYGQSVASYDMQEGYVAYKSLSDATLGIATSNTNNLNIYPNPVKAGSNITISNPENNISTMKIIDQNGKQVFSNEVNWGQGINNLNIPSFINSGSYLLQSIDKNGNTSSTTKIIIE